MPMIGSRSKYYNKLQYNTDSTSHSHRVSSRVANHNVRVPSRVRVIQGLRLESSRESRVHSSRYQANHFTSRLSVAPRDVEVRALDHAQMATFSNVSKLHISQLKTLLGASCGVKDFLGHSLLLFYSGFLA